MPDSGFNMLLFGSPGSHLAAVVRELKALGSGQVRLASTLSAFELKLSQARFDLAVLCFDDDMEADEALVDRLHGQLTRAGAPTVVVVDHPLSLVATGSGEAVSPVLSRFEIVIGSPIDGTVLEQSVELALTLSGSWPREDQSDPVDREAVHEAATRELPSVDHRYPPPVGHAGTDSEEHDAWPSGQPGHQADHEDDELGDSALEVRSWGAPPVTDEGEDDPDSGDVEHSDAPEPAGDGSDAADDEPKTIVIDGHIVDPRAVLEAALRDADAGVEASPDSGGAGAHAGEQPAVSDTGTRIEVRRWDDTTEQRDEAETATHRLVDDESDGPPLESELPPLRRGSLKHHAPRRVLLAHEIAASTGVLRFENGGIARELVLLEGVPGSDSLLDIDDKERRRLMGALLWTEGRYTFDGRRVNPARFRSLGSVLELVHAAMINGLTVNQASSQLTQHFKSYVAITERTRDQWDVLGKLPGLWDLLTSLGVGPLEQVIAKAGTGFETALKNLVFCQEMDLIAFSDKPRTGRVPVEHRRSQITTPGPLPPPTHIGRRQSSDSSTSSERRDSVSRSVREAPQTTFERRGASASRGAATPSAEASGPPADGAQSKRSKPPPPVPDDEDHSDAAIDELASIVEAWNGRSAYEIFGLWEGCGADAVRERYYELVRRHHPDTYGLARSPDVKPLAEMVFRTVQKAYTELRRSERGDASRPAPSSFAGEADDEASGLGPSSLGDAIQAGAGDSSLGYRPGRSSPGVRSGDTSSPGSRSSPGQRSSGSFRTAPVTAVRPAPGTTSSPGQRPSTPRAGVTGVADEAASQPGVSDPGSLSAQDLPTERAEQGTPTSGSAAAVSSTGTPAPGQTGEGPAIGAPLVDSATDNPAQPTLRHRSVTDSATRLRALAARMASGGHPVANVASGAREAIAQQQKLPPEQHFRNGVNMIKVGAFERAIDELQTALEGRPSSGIYQAYLAWARYRVDPATSVEQKKVLQELLHEPTAEELSALFLGHILMAEGDEEDALDYYQRCLTLNPKNVEAQRRVRLFRMRQSSKKEGLLDRLFSKKQSKKKSPKGR